jgi:hypothetical protein
MMLGGTISTTSECSKNAIPDRAAPLANGTASVMA